ncbi:MAG: ABC transporter ATP-binding protein [Deltaproteobacteria bacterium]|mgnify:CR=1 FL=1|nr:ABC transporter ATP-binding protein [Deltaproteobacteria bacterium]MBW1922651.1 ABC transporter ATP-binding protein [Deltaproteobacteria bacterium]MBW1948722.1 ABC transporter ATP-binding protein [Deltaproteobacteria bacterium]MBW2008085.1 ABC transporter ATP-binding protein [Deltaproteobacteria bacterium]MBW2102264.1 ABC transporter ATP-binding protein [Deltaproteobacteria bacterium]
MKAFRGEPSIYASARPEDIRAELEVKDLTLKFGGITALNKINLEVHTGELVAVIGPNGAGKTSLLNCITGYYKPQEGEIRFNGENITHLSTHHLTRIGIGRTYQNIELFPGMTVLSNMLLARHIHSRYDMARASVFSRGVRREEIRHRRILEELIDFLEMQSIRKAPVGSLPYGLRKRVELGRALALEPRLLVLDEPFAGMTLEEKEDMVRFLMELNEAWNQTMILVEHDMSVVMSISQRVMVLDFGVKLAEGSPDFIQNHPQVIKAYLGDTATID